MPTYKVRRVLRDLQRKCEEVKNNHGSHQKFRNPKNGKITSVPVHMGKDMDESLVRKIYKDLGLILDY